MSRSRPAEATLTLPNGVSTQYGYDAAGKQTRLYLTSATYDYTFFYDTMGRFEKIFLTNGAQLFQYYYDAASNETERHNLPNGVNQVYLRDALNRMLYMDAKKGTTTLAHEGYSYDGMNRITGVTYSAGAADSFHYYLDGELNTATVGYTSHTLTYNLDNKGNRTSVQDTANPTTTYSPNPIDQYTSVSNNSIANGPEHEIQTYNGVAYSYINDERLQFPSIDDMLVAIRPIYFGHAEKDAEFTQIVDKLFYWLTGQDPNDKTAPRAPSLWKALHGYTHPGARPLSRLFTGGQAQRNYSEFDVAQLLNLPTIALILLMGPFFISMGKQAEADEVQTLALQYFADFNERLNKGQH